MPATHSLQRLVALVAVTTGAAAFGASLGGVADVGASLPTATPAPAEAVRVVEPCVPRPDRQAV